jgi:hypothetical protein
MGFTRIKLPYIGIVMMHMRVFLIKSPFQRAMGWVPILEYMLSCVCSLLWPCLIPSGNECSRPLWPWCWPCLSGNGSPRLGWLDARVPPRPGQESDERIGIEIICAPSHMVR